MRNAPSRAGLQQYLATSAVTGSAALSLLLGTGAAATLTGGRLADHIGPVATIRIGYLLVPPGLIGLLLAPTLYWPPLLGSAAPFGELLQLFSERCIVTVC